MIHLPSLSKDISSSSVKPLCSACPPMESSPAGNIPDSPSSAFTGVSPSLTNVATPITKITVSLQFLK